MSRQDQIIEQRMKKLASLKKAGIDPYPNKFDVKDKSIDLQEKHKSLKPEKYSKETAKLAGRLMTFRDLGKISFGTLQDSYGKIQVVLQEGETPETAREFFTKYVDAGDIIGVEGKIFRTKRGELSILLNKVEM